MTKIGETNPKSPAKARPRQAEAGERSGGADAETAQAKRPGADGPEIEAKADSKPAAASPRRDGALKAQAAEKWVNALTTAKPPVRPSYPTRARADAAPAGRATAAEPSRKPDEPKGRRRDENAAAPAIREALQPATEPARRAYAGKSYLP